MDVSATNRKPINGGPAIDETLLWPYEAYGARSYYVPLLSGISINSVSSEQICRAHWIEFNSHDYQPLALRIAHMHSFLAIAVLLKGNNLPKKALIYQEVGEVNLSLSRSSSPVRKSVHPCSPIGMSLIETPSTGPVGSIPGIIPTCSSIGWFLLSPMGSMYGISTYIALDFYGFHVGKYCIPTWIQWVCKKILAFDFEKKMFPSLWQGSIQKDTTLPASSMKSHSFFNDSSCSYSAHSVSSFSYSAHSISSWYSTRVWARVASNMLESNMFVNGMHFCVNLYGAKCQIQIWFIHEENIGCEVPHLICLHATPCYFRKKSTCRRSLSIHVFGTLIEGSLFKGRCGIGVFGTAVSTPFSGVLKNVTTWNLSLKIDLILKIAINDLIKFVWICVWRHCYYISNFPTSCPVLQCAGMSSLSFRVFWVKKRAHWQLGATWSFVSIDHNNLTKIMRCFLFWNIFNPCGTTIRNIIS